MRLVDHIKFQPEIFLKETPQILPSEIECLGKNHFAAFAVYDPRKRQPDAENFSGSGLVDQVGAFLFDLLQKTFRERRTFIAQGNFLDDISCGILKNNGRIFQRQRCAKRIKESRTESQPDGAPPGAGNSAPVLSVFAQISLIQHEFDAVGHIVLVQVQPVAESAPRYSRLAENRMQNLKYFQILPG